MKRITKVFIMKEVFLEFLKFKGSRVKLTLSFLIRKLVLKYYIIGSNLTEWALEVATNVRYNEVFVGKSSN